MRVFVTGATGLVGGHTALALLLAGHDVRLLVRSEAKARHYFDPHGFASLDCVVADMTDTQAVASALEGCDAVVHAAVRLELSPLLAKEVYTDNTRSIDAVIGTAVKAGIRNILWVSSTSIFFNRIAVNARADETDEMSPLGTLTSAYVRSKRDGELQVRRLQAQGAPVQISYPGVVVGPDDPGLSESNRALRAWVKSVPRTSSGIQVVDARDLALIHCHLLENPHLGDPEDARYIVAGHYHEWSQFHALLQTVCAHKIAHPRLPGPFMRGLGRVLDVYRRVHPFETAISAEAMAVMTQANRASSNRVLDRTGIEFRNSAETLRDTVRWLMAMRAE